MFKCQRRVVSSACVCVCVDVSYIIIVDWTLINTKTSFEDHVLNFSGPGLWINGYRGTATCDADTYGVLSDGLWVI